MDTLFKDYGLLGIVVGVIATMLFFILKWVLAQFKTELECNRAERKDYLISLNKINEQIAEHNTRSKEFQVCTAAEHKGMIEVLGRINGYTYKGEKGEKGEKGDKGDKGDANSRGN